MTTDLGPAIQEARLAGKGYKAIAKETGLSRDVIRGFCKKNGLAGERGPTRPKRAAAVCRGCGKDFLPKTKDRITYCSRECAYAHARQFKEARLGAEAAAREERRRHVCQVCGKEFRGRASALYCSEGCRKEGGRLKFKASFVSVRQTNPYITKRCEHCGEEFQSNFYTETRHYCSARCNRAAYRAKHPEVHSAGNRRRRARLAGALTEPYDVQAIYERDGWRCQLCGKKVNPALKHPHPLAAEPDHIIPVACRGPDVPRNVRLAHHICNTRRGTRGTAQLRLF